MWKTPKRKKSELVESLIFQEGVPEAEGGKCQQVEESHRKHRQTPAHWHGKKEVFSKFVRDFFNHSHKPRNEDENISLRVLGN